MKLAVAFVCVLLFPGIAHAQGKGALELGVDLGASAVFLRLPSYDSFGSEALKRFKARTLEIEAPVSAFRIGLFVTDRLEIEPSFGFAFGLVQNGDSGWQAGGSGSAAFSTNYYFTGNTSGFSPFAKAGFVTRFNVPLYYIGSGQDFQYSGSKIGIPIGLGARIPWGRPVALRVATDATWWVDTTSYWSLSLRLGISAFPGAGRDQEGR